MTWAIARTPSGQEMYFAERLSAAGQTAFVPTVTTTTRPSGMRFPVKSERPRFPAYLFVQAATISYLDPVYQDSRFRGFLKVAYQIAFVPDGVIRALRAWDGCEDIPEPKPVEYAPGELVRVLEGIFGDYKGIVQPWSGEGVRVRGCDFLMATTITDLKNIERLL